MVRKSNKTNRIARRLGVNLYEKPRSPLLHKKYPPGMHGQKRKKPSDYGMQLEEKQKICAVYGRLTKKVLVKYYREALRQHGNTPEILLQLIESRLDVLVHKMFTTSIFQAQQIVFHGHVLVDGKRVDIRSYLVKPGQTISIKEKMRANPNFKMAFEGKTREVPEYISVDKTTMTGKYLNLPAINDVNLAIPINPATVCEFLAYTS